MASKRLYAGAARFIEIAPPGIAFRSFCNVDHITSVTFGEKIKEIEVPVGEPKDGEEQVMEKKNIPVGYTVTISVGTANNEFTFPNPEIAVKFWNEVLADIERVGVPVNRKPKMVPTVKPVEKSPIVGSDGKAMEAANIEPGYEGEDLEDPVMFDDDDPAPELDELKDIDELIDEAETADENKTPTEH